MRSRILKATLCTLLLIPISFNIFTSLVHFYSIKIDEETDATYIVDGDTFDTSSGKRIRLADVNAPDRGEWGYNEATNVLSQLIYNKRVYLDIDDISVKDPYGRYVCLVYADYNATHYLNVNRALLVMDVAVVDDYYNNEFNPHRWTQFNSKLRGSSYIKLLTYAIGLGFVITLVIYYVSKRIWARTRSKSTACTQFVTFKRL